MFIYNFILPAFQIYIQIQEQINEPNQINCNLKKQNKKFDQINIIIFVTNHTLCVSHIHIHAILYHFINKQRKLFTKF